MNALVFSQSEARNFFMYIITREMASAPKLPDPPNPVSGPVPFEGVSPSVIDQSNWSSFPSFLHWQKPESKEHTPGEKNNRHFFQTFLLYLQKENLFPGGQILLFLDGLKYRFLFLFGQLFTLVWKFSIFSRGEVGT